jgi:hypothetical protein
VRSNPNVEAIALVSHVPLGSGLREGDYPDAPGLNVTAMEVEPSFFELMRLTILLGRAFNSSDHPRGAAIISRRLAMTMYGGVNVLGQPFPKSEPGRQARYRRSGG